MNKGRQIPRIIWPLLALALILFFNLIFTDAFFSITIKDGHLFGSLIDILRRSAPTLIMAVAMTYVIATGGIDISVGSVLAISGSIASLVVWGGNTEYLTSADSTYYAPILAIILIPLVASVLLGAFNGLMVSVVGLQPFIATLILMTAGRGLAQLLTGGKVLNFSHEGFEFVGRGYLFGIPFPFILALGVILLGFAVTRFTPMGLYIQAVGGNRSASNFSGINTKIVLLFVYIFSGFAAGLSGLVMTSDITGADAGFMGLYMELDAILAVVIGGTPMEGGKYNVGGTVVGVFIIQTLTTTILTKGIPTEYTLLVKAIVVVVVLIIQSNKMREVMSMRRRAIQGKEVRA
ncbi:ABC transporter permease [Pleomorphochaeta sp. DL1XJH-081]|jgi:simple sugar transport system permease protein|uniref:ABC transporter permease n=1 Tax=Pleomorphochaeta sp. DL1XJH-081 TaxID=3409690 RepID=UPI003BB7F3BB